MVSASPAHALKSPRIDRSRLVSRVCEIIRRQGLRAGDRLPSEGALARKFSVSRMTLRDITGELVRQNILERRHGVGIFVRNPTVLSIGIFTGARAILPATAIYSHWVLNELRLQIQARQGHSHLFLFDDAGRFDHLALRAIRNGEINGALLFSTPQTAEQLQREVLSVFAQRKIPVVGVTKYEPESLHRVHQDLPAMVRDVVLWMASRGFREIGLVSGLFQPASPVLPLVLSEARRAGVRIENEWILTGDVTEKNAIERGRRQYEQFEKIRNAPPALLFYDQFELQGFMHAQLARARRIPDAPALIVVEAQQASLELPWPVNRILVDMRPLMNVSMQMLFDLMDGRPVPQREISLKTPITSA